MFMFQNGLLASFIPEILMVIGYMLCFFVSTAEPEIEKSNEPAINSQSYSFELSNTTSDTTTYNYFNQIYQSYQTEIIPTAFFSKIKSFAIYSHNIKLTEMLSFVQFSRPPPKLL